MHDKQYKFPCEDFSHTTHKWGVEYSNDKNGDEILHVDWFTTKEDRDLSIEGKTA